MEIDLSILKSIDFLNPDNLLFLAIFLVAVIIVFSVVLFILLKIIKAIKIILRKIFNIDARKPKFGQKESADWLRSRQQESKKAAALPKQKVMGGDFIKTSTAEEKEPKEQEYKQKYEAKEQKDIAEGLAKLKSEGSAEEGTLESKMPSRSEEGEEKNKFEKIKIPTIEKFGEKGAAAPGQPDITKPAPEIGASFYEKPEENKNTEKYQIEKLKTALTTEALEKDEDIKKRLKESRKFKDNVIVKWVVKIMKREKKTEEEEKNKKEEKKKEEGEIADIISSGIHAPGLVYEKEKIESARKTIEEKNKGQADYFPGGVPETASEKIAEFFTGNAPKESSASKGASNAPTDESIFGGQPEVSKIKLTRKMRLDPKIWRAQRQMGLTLSPVERSKLVKEVFSPALGRNISKSDLKWSIKKLSLKMLDTKDPAEHAKIRKEIKFFKKIGGIK